MQPNKLKPFATKLDEDLVTELRVHSTVTGTRIGTIVDQALRDYLAKHEDKVQSSEFIKSRVTKYR